MRWSLLSLSLLVLTLVLSSCSSDSLTANVVHEQYTSFSSLEDRFDFNARSFSDDAIYSAAFFSVNGSSWQELSLFGDSYSGSSSWLDSSVSFSLPSELSTIGEHYLLFYSCSLLNSSWDCHPRNDQELGFWQLHVINNSVSLPPDEPEIADYYVAPDGDDYGLGTIDDPWRTWGKAARTAQAGDLVYFRDGVYYDPADNIGGVRDFNTGTPDSPIRFFAYPGETPILDCSLHEPNEGGYNKGIAMGSVDNIHLKGLTVRNVFQVEMDVNAVGLTMYYVGNITIENMVIHNVDGEANVVYAYHDTIEYINCDAYNMNDALRSAVPPNPGVPGQNGAGFHQGLHADVPGAEDARLIYRGCRAWNYSDNGFAGTSVGYVEYDTCWAFDGGMLYGEGCGFKYASTYGAADNNSLPLARVIKNSIGALNGGYGFSPNNRGDIPLSGHYYNNFAFRNGYKGNPYWGYGFVISNYFENTPGPNEMYSNNLAYDDEFGPLYDSDGGNVYIHEYNSWDQAVTLSDDDFVSLDWTQLMRPRKADGSLPDITFGKLVEGSDLIDNGTDVGLPYLGVAPDLGPFEFVDLDSSCDDIVCASGEYCSRGVCLLEVSGNTYFVAVDGDDIIGDGSFENPWASFQKAVDESLPGDLTYFRGGTYDLNTTIDVYPPVNGLDGTPDNYIHYFNYPGEHPFFDGSSMLPPEGGPDGYKYGLKIVGAEYIRFKGMEFKIGGVSSNQCSHLSFENMVVHHVEGHGFLTHLSNDINYTNCDSHSNWDPLNVRPGNTADGFQAWRGEDHPEDVDSRISYVGCRAWNNSDDGFDTGYVGLVTYDNCWSWDNGHLEDGDGYGFKFGFINVDIDPLSRKITRCVSTYNKKGGFHENSYDPDEGTMNSNIFNNIAYKNTLWGFYGPNTDLWPENQKIYRNNIAYGNYEVQGTEVLFHEINSEVNSYVHSNNSWDSDVIVDDGDFVLLPQSLEEIYTILSADRQSDGSLPDIGGYFKLAEGSDLIDAGIDVGLPFNGSAPDIGAFESNFTLSTECNCLDGYICQVGACIEDSRVIHTIEGETFIHNTSAVWAGIPIPRYVPTLFTFKNNLIVTNSTQGYMLQCGTDGPTDYNNNLDDATIWGNMLDWNANYTGGSTHGIMAGYSVNYDIRYNYFDTTPYGIVIEGLYNMTYDSGGVTYNIFKNNRVYSILAHGQDDVFIYNNVFYNDKNPTYILGIKTNTQYEPNEPSTGVKIKNNIFYSTTSYPDPYAFVAIDTASLSSLECDYNVYYVEAGDHKPGFKLDNTYISWEEWRALGLDEHSVILDPTFIDTISFVPTSRLNHGTDLGAEWETGLAIDATWVPGFDPATTVQNGVWQVGARIYD